MSLVSTLGRFAGIVNEAPPPVVLGDQQTERRALLARAQRGRIGLSDMLQPPKSRNDMAQEFCDWIMKTRGIDLNVKNDQNTALMDDYVDSVRTSQSHELDGRRGEQAAAWIGERVRNDQNLSWTEDSLVTDGRLAFDPAAALRARLDSAEAPTITQAVDDAMGRIERETLAATTA